MTRLAVLADIHGNLPALEAIIADMAQNQIDHVIVAGDSINVGPDSAAVVERIMAARWAVIRGNNEYYLLDYNTDRAPAHWQRFVLLPWLRQQINQDQHTLIAAWPDTLCLRYPDAPPVRVAHGSPRSHWESIYPDTPEDEIAAMLDGIEETTIIVGHTHLQFERQVGPWYIINPGSAGLVSDGLPGANYAILDGSPAGWTVTFRRVDFDYEALYAGLARSGITELPGVIGELVLREFQTSRLQLLPFMRWREDQHPNRPSSPELLAQFTDAIRWAYTPAPYHMGI